MKKIKSPAQSMNDPVEVRQICPFCYRKFKQIFRHRCQIAPMNFSFRNKKMHSSVHYLRLYQKLGIFNSKTHYIDGTKLDRKKYQRFFIKMYLRLSNNLELSIDQIWDDKAFSDQEAIVQFEASIRHPAPKIIKKSYTSSKIPKVCPYCFDEFIRLDFHKCKKSPLGSNFRKFLGDDAFYKHLYQETEGWDDRGFLLKSKLNRKKYTEYCTAILSALNGANSDVYINAEGILIRLIAQQRLKAKRDTDRSDSSKIPSKLSSIREFPDWDQFSHKYELASLNNETLGLILLCPFCMHQITDFRDHSCKFKPYNFEFSSDLVANQMFCAVSFSLLDAIDSSGQFDIYLLNRTLYLQIFLKYYTRIFFPKQIPASHSDSEETYLDTAEFSLPDNQFDIKVQEKLNFYEKLYINRKNVKQVCPFCISQYNDLSKHLCKNLPDSYPTDFHVPKYLCTDWIFVYLYQNIGIWNRSGKIDVFKLNGSLYKSLFEECFNLLNKANPPSLKYLITKRYEAQILQQEKEEQLALVQEKIESKLKKKPKKRGTVIQQLCPWCFSLFPSLDLHQCVDRPLNFPPQFEFQDINSDDFFIQLYYKTDGLTKTNQIDLYRINRQKYQDEFFYAYEKYFEKLSHDQQKQQQFIGGDDVSEVISGLDLDVDEEFEDLDVLELLSKDIDITPSRPKKQKQEIEMEPGIPWCFMCKNMMDCPKGVDSQQMETIFECDLFISQEISPIKKSQDEPPIKRQSEKSSKSQSKEETNALILEIMKKWEATRGKLDVYCTKCETEMKKIITSTKEFYRCNNYPECNITADPWYIKRAVESGIFSHKEHGDLLILFKYDKDKNIVKVSEIFSDGKLFL
ncbi:hypothetical protein NEF87_001320 [Candidatus Lokiarchaeum ossiferum]|uniref:DNA topoisomerase type IA zn finger domain-containing protein n=1 Tax=Candidatus Lokiarchaeum ossiferum TaxID=2951803 RepID=A0ABY6HNQ8_9ARCH|nr:hypothetical protein NEF87_001320 [Candidatus Lokiarchaeum sp. B-35]